MRNSDEMLQALYDDVAQTYRDSVVRTNYIGPQWLLKNLHSKFKTGAINILDLGCANGINIANLKQINPSIIATGVDISSKMLVEAKKSRLYEQLYQHNLDTAFTFSREKNYDAVIALGCLEFVNDIDFCLTEVARVCKKGGYFYATFQRFEPDNPSAPKHMKSGEVTHFAYTTDQIRAKLYAAGFEIISIDKAIGYTGGVPCPYSLVVAQRSNPLTQT